MGMLLVPFGVLAFYLLLVYIDHRSESKHKHRH